MTFHHPQLLALLVLLPVLVLIWVWRGMRTVPTSLVLRLIAVALVVVALANPTQGRDTLPAGPLIILVDQSDSLTSQGQAALRAEANRLVASLNRTSGAEARQPAVLWFGANVVAPGDWSNGGAFDEPASSITTALDASGSDIAGALQSARDVLSASTAATGQPGHIVLLSDGIQTAGDALSAARLAADANLRVDVLPLAASQTPEVRIASVQAPRLLSAGEEYAVQIVINSTAPPTAASTSQATLRLWDADQLLAEQQVNLTPGDNPFTLRSRASNAGVIRLRAEVVATPDTFQRNNEAAATAVVAPPPLVLIIEGRLGSTQTLSTALWNAGIESETITPDRLPTRLSSLERFDGMILADVSANSLTFDQMASVQEFVRSEGRGLVATGGVNSFGLGGYANTPLEQVLPVDMDAPPRPDRTDVALLLIIDRSASMDTAIGVSKFDMAKEAAILSTESLQENDIIGVLAFDTGQQWVVPFQRIGQGNDLQQIQDSIGRLPTGGGTDIYRALAMGVNELVAQPASVRHVVLLTDGRSFTDDRFAYQQLVEAARSQGMTISTIAIGVDADTELLDNIAQWGGGRYSFANNPEDIPRLTLQESEIARADPSVEGTFYADLVAPHPLLRNFVPAELPQLDGYVATTLKDAAEVVLRSPEEDPVLVTWQYGLGRAIAWTSSVADPWADTWTSWGDYSRFWAQVVRYTLPEADSNALQVRLEPQHGGARLVADAFAENGAPLNLADAAARITLPDGSTRDIPLRQVSPGRYAQDLRLPTDGAYGILVVLERDGQRYQTQVGYVQAVPAEYAPPDPTSSQLQGEPLLQQIAQITGGRVLPPNTTLDTPGQDDQTEAVQQEDPLRNLWMWLLGAALAIWVLEIAVRRGIFIRDKT